MYAIRSYYAAPQNDANGRRRTCSPPSVLPRASNISGIISAPSRPMVRSIQDGSDIPASNSVVPIIAP